MEEQQDFTTSLIERRFQESNQWFKLKRQVNWCVFDEVLNETNRTGERGGRPPYNPNQMFRLILLGQWHDLSDEELEYSLTVRLDFLSFCGFNLSCQTPDRSTINRFRNQLVKQDLLPKCLKLLNEELERLGLKIKSGRLSIDSTIIESAARPKNVIEPGDDDNPPTKKTSADEDSAWTKKGNKFHYGYKEHAIVEVEQGFVESLEVTPANVHDTRLLQKMVDEEDAGELLADKGYASKANREYLNRNQIEDKILRKGNRNRPLTKEDIEHNKKISKKRFIVEQYFGTKKRKFNFFKTRYFGLQQVKGQALLKAICFNILKAKNILAPPRKCPI